MKKIVLTGGGTAGHIYPALAVKDELGAEYQVFYIGSNGMEKDIVEKEQDITFFEIDAVKLERKLAAKNLLIPIKLCSSIRQARAILKKLRPNIVFSKGGFVALPVVYAAKSLGIPVISHESDLSFGLANKLILKKCDVMCTSFRQTARRKKCVFTGQPIRKKVLKGKKEVVLEAGDFNPALPNVLVVGGSLGAKFLNEMIWKNIDTLAQKFNIVLIAGKNAAKKMRHKNFLQVDYAQNIGDFYNFADIAISRAGSGVINELAALKIPSLLVPLSKACSRGDQIENAKLFEQEGCALVLEEENFSLPLLLEKLENLSKNAAKFKKNLKNRQNFDASKKIVELIKKIEIKNPLS